ncbi:SDR family oxidoreductase [Chloroflexota bacterium]
MRLSDRVAIVTGAGSGIGRELAITFAGEGAKVVVADINDAGGEETAAAIRSDGGEAIFVHTDVSLASDAENLIKQTIDKFGRIDILHNNAGIGQKPTPLENLDESSWDSMYAVNVKGIFLTAKYAIPPMKKAKKGVIINTGSMAGVSPKKDCCAYCSSKAAAINLTKALAVELAPYNIRVNCINPTRTATSLAREWTVPPDVLLGRIATPKDIAYAAVYLASDESAMLTGTAINVDGGEGI